MNRYLWIILSWICLLTCFAPQAQAGNWFSEAALSARPKPDHELSNFLVVYDDMLHEYPDAANYRGIFVTAYNLLIKNYVFALDSNKRKEVLAKAQAKMLKKRDSLLQLKEPVTAKAITYAALSGLYSSLDPHTTWLSPEDNQFLKNSIDGEYYGVGIVLGVEQGDKYVKALEIIENGPADKAGIKMGDYIYKVDNIAYTAQDLESVANALRSKTQNTVNLEIIRGQTNHTFIFKRGVVQPNSVKYTLIDNQYAYIKVTTFNQNTTTEFRKALKNINPMTVKGIILDLRNNPGGLLYSSLIIADMFLNDGMLLSVKGRDPTLNSTIYATKGINVDVNIPLLILINNMTASAAEIVTIALQQNNRAIVMGQQSFGKGSVQTIFDLKDNSSAKVTIQLFYTPHGEALQGVGVIPNISVNPEHKNPFYDIRENSYRNKLTIDHFKSQKTPNLVIDEKSCLPYGENQDKIIGCAIDYFQANLNSNKGTK